MTKYCCKWLFILLTYLMCLTGCNSNKVENKLEIKNKNLELKVEELERKIDTFNNIEVKVKSELSNSIIKDILHVKQINGTYYIVLMINNDGNIQLWKYTGEPFATLLEEGINLNIEIRDPYLYCTVKKKIGIDEYKEEVIKFDNDNNKSLIYEGNNLEISASPDGKYFIIIENPDDQIELKDMNFKNSRNLKILDRNDKIIYEENIPSKLTTALEPLGWNESNFWATFNYASGKPEIFILDINTLKYQVIENKADRFESELNIKTGWFCYSDFPQFRDIDTYNEFKQSDKEVNLYLWNLFSDKKIEIEKSIAKAFAPKWINDYTFEYNNPNNNQKILYKLN